MLRQVERAHYNPSLRIFHIHRIRRRDTKYLAQRRQRAVVRHRSRRSFGGTHRCYWRERCLVIVPISSVGRPYIMYLPGSSVLVDKSFVSRIQRAACSPTAVSSISGHTKHRLLKKQKEVGARQQSCYAARSPWRAQLECYSPSFGRMRTSCRPAAAPPHVSAYLTTHALKYAHML
jgi:hypothetical protein